MWLTHRRLFFQDLIQKHHNVIQGEIHHLESAGREVVVLSVRLQDDQVGGIRTGHGDGVGGLWIPHPDKLEMSGLEEKNLLKALVFKLSVRILYCNRRQRR